MDTTQQPEALAELRERLRSFEADHTPDGWPAVRMRDITALLDDLDNARSDNRVLRLGYAAARLEIESLKAQLHAAKQINAAQFGLLAASIPGSALRVPHGQAPAQPAQRFDAADMATAAAQGFRDGEASAASWISVDARLPEPDTPVLLDIGKKYPIRALWAAKNTVRVGTDVDDWGEYDEETDEYYCPEGWYEWNEHEDVHWAVSETPRAWRELPPPLPTTPHHSPPCGWREQWVNHSQVRLGSRL